jgi:hypothetical protein
MVKIAWEREDVVFIAVSLLWRADRPRERMWNASYTKILVSKQTNWKLQSRIACDIADYPRLQWEGDGGTSAVSA